MSFERLPLERTSAIVIDHCRYSRALLADVLRQIGLGAVKTTGSTANAVAVIKTMTPQIIFTELHPANPDAIDVLKWVRMAADSPDPMLPVVMVARAASVDEVLAARDSGVTEFLTHPFTLNEVKKRLMAALASHRRFVRSISYVGPCRRRRRIDYHGPLRRGEDPHDVDADGGASTQAILMADVIGLSALGRSLNLSERRHLVEVRGRAARVVELAREINDEPMADAAQHLIKCLDDMDATGGLNRDVVLRVVSAMSQMAEIEGGATSPERRAIARRLHDPVEPAAAPTP